MDLLAGKVDGYFGNQAIRILMPEQLKSLESGLRAVGYGPKMDEFVLSMNRAAERAAPAAKTKTTDKLTAAFKPVIDRSMDEVGVTRQYKELVGRFEAIPFVKTRAFDLEGYVTGKGLDGLFQLLGEQERQIRVNPAARTTELLKDVFGRR